ncbi:pyrimidine/purine nucleoside phosphorylase [Fundidesulfovibrio terrae]|uniref:pyrimidine/purine nucleoside phosphorylase n=1 Tax=Fundidesulfovibrio terrae TaxID=2922866 RepID=UPI001FAF406C|nr:pyrimidine/purine nucleoside phosphorylase [Fundidesulfovibrio terrae]
MSFPESFENVTVKTLANVYFHGKVVSHTITEASGQRRSLGVCHAGTFTFTTGDPEIMEITAGNVRAKVDGEDEWGVYGPGQSFHIPANTSFEMVVESELAQYICTFG